MPLSAPVEREEVYFRHTVCTGYRRDDGLWDIDARFVDRRPFDYPCFDRGGMVPAGESFHDLLLRLTVDDDLTVCRLEVKLDKFPYKQCPCAEAAFKAVVGLKICAGFSKEVHRAIPAKSGCAHLFGLLVEAAGAAFQAVSQVRLMKYCRGVKPDPLDSCVAWDSAGEMVKRQWPDWYKAGNDGTAD